MLRIFHLTRCYLLLSLSTLLPDVHVRCQQRELNINLGIVHQWAEQFTDNLLTVTDTATGAGFLEDSYAQYKGKIPILPNRDVINETLEEVRKQLEQVLDAKEKAVENMVKAAEAVSQEYGAYKKTEQLDPEEITYYNAKKLVSDENVMQMSVETQEEIKKTIHYLKLNGMREEFNYNKVNLNVSTIHVPTNIYDKSMKILNGVSWSENITNQFVQNMQMDPSLTWQYFCSSDGFFRIFPGIIWPRDPDKVDMFDCRVRNWYIQAATTPKNIVILMDASGSMKGLRMEIARNTVDKILDTLSNDDYFNILEFSEEVSYVDECSNRTLMQASVDNRRRMQEEIKNVGTVKMANFKKALVEAFKLFENVEKDLKRVLCNKAIMLVTDGAPENYEETFEEYNWPNKTIRVFTYLIGKEVSDNRQVRWMACANKGDHKHISTRADVQENVQQYIKVLSRPMVQQRYHNLVWTAAYLDYVTEQSPMKETLDGPLASQNDLLFGMENIGQIQKEYNKGLGLMITVAMPVFDTREATGVDDESPEGNLLGVVGTDVRTYELKKYIPIHKLGVNGYAFAITNHGYIIFHPDFRPMFQKDKNDPELSPKPNYNSVDLSEVELADNPSVLQELRQAMLETRHSSLAMNVTVHYDGMTRYRKRSNLYFFKKVSNVFSLALVIPKGYGEYQIRPQSDHEPSDAEVLNDKLLFIAPWIFCKNTSTGQQAVMKKEHLLELVKKTHKGHLDCDKDLIRMLVYEAKQTEDYTKIWTGEKEYWGRGKINTGSPIKKEYKKCWGLNKIDCYKKTHQKYGIELLFMGTSFGISRFMSVLDNPKNLTDMDFSSSSLRTIQEPYYRRAVDGWQDGYNYTFFLRKSTDTQVFNPDNSTMVISSPEVLNRTGKKGAVAAVVGMQMKYTKFLELFENITAQCPSDSECDFTCNDTDYLNCYLLDNSGFVMASNNKDGNDTNKFFGTVDSSLMKELVKQQVYDSMTVIDYQGVCKIYASDQESSASRLINPIVKTFGWLMWGMTEFIVFFSEWTFYSIVNMVNIVRGESYEEARNDKNPVVDFYFKFLVDSETQERVRKDHVVDQEACDKQVTLYSLNVSTLKQENRNGLIKSITGCGECNRYNENGTYIVKWIQDTNLILVVAAANCSCGDGEEISLNPEKIKYDDEGKCKRLSKLSHPPRSKKCFDSTIEEGNRCGGHRTKSSLLLLVLLTLKALLS